MTLEEYRRRIRGYADANPELMWVTGGGWSLEAFPGGVPTRQQLDELVPDRPAYLVNRDHHGAWANSRALELAGLTADTPDPADGRIERDATGRPAGTLQEGAMRLVADLVPRPTSEDLVAALLRAQALLHSYGITAWQDAIVGGNPLTADAAPAYLAAVREGRLTARVVGALWWDRARGVEQIPELLDRRERDELTIPFLGPERAARQYPFADLRAAGATLAAGSDWPVSSADPIQGIHVAVNRRLPEAGEDVPVFLPGQRLDLGTAIAAYTAGSAYVNHLDDTGTIEPGKLADLVVLDRDPFDGPAAQITETRVLQTFVGGDRVHAAPDA